MLSGACSTRVPEPGATDGEGKSPDGRGRRLLREVQSEAEDLQRSAGQDGQWAARAEGRVPGVRDRNVQDPSAVEVSPQITQVLRPTPPPLWRGRFFLR